ncbi:MAG: zeta toxin family protein [Rikenellaceae bacterium]|jgi:predicted ABC-type ATPase|nr:zeta toxin family protein [Rikenellaceae bacterium]
MPKLYIIAGCNGAGKTTASYTVLPEMLDCREFVNADEIAKGLSPFNPESVAIEAGRLMLTRIRELMDSGGDFAFETTLSTRSYVNFVKDARRLGYHITLVYFWLNSPELAIDRVAERVAAGGHNIDEATVRRRYAKGLHNLFELYIDISDYWMIIDNSRSSGDVIAEGERNETKLVYDPLIYKTLEGYGQK